MKRQLIAAAALALFLQTPLISQTRPNQRSLKKKANQPSRTGHTSQKPKPRPNLATEPTLYVVGYAHLDTEWRWEYPQTIGEYLPKTMRNNFAFFEKYPNYIFNFTGANRYRLIKEYYPSDFERLKQYVASGCWFAAIATGLASYFGIGLGTAERILISRRPNILASSENAPGPRSRITVANAITSTKVCDVSKRY